MSSNGLGFSSLTDHEELRQDSHRFQVDRESPEDLQGSETVVLKEGEANDWDQKKLQAECVILTVKRFPKFPIDHVHCDIGTEEKNHLHHCVVDGDEVGEQVQVPGGEDESEKDLALPRDARAALGPPNLPQEQDHGQEVAQVAEDSEHVHGPARAQPTPGKLSGGPGGCHVPVPGPGLWVPSPCRCLRAPSSASALLAGR